jgi:hypothetical protein
MTERDDDPDRQYPIPGFPGYMITKSGQVWSYKRALPKQLGVEPKHNSKINTWFRSVGLSRGGVVHTFTVANLLGLVFLPNPNNLPVVSHKNLNPLDDRLENLYWTDKRVVGRKVGERRLRRGVKVSPQQMKKMRAAYESGKSPAEIHKTFPNVSVGYIRQICSGRRKTGYDNV